MIITYEFVNGDKAEIEVTEEFAEIQEDIERLEYNNEHAETRRRAYIEIEPDGRGYEGEWFATYDSNSEHIREMELDAAYIRAEIESLPLIYQHLIQKVFVQGMGKSEYARYINVSPSTVTKRIKKIQKKLKKFYGKW